MGWVEDLEKIGQLRDKGLLTDAEWEEQKRLLLPSSPAQPSIAELSVTGDQNRTEITEPEYKGVFLVLTVAVVAFASLFFPFIKVPFFTGIDIRLKNFDDSTVSVLAFQVVPCLFIAGILIGRIQSRFSRAFAAVPVALVALPDIISYILLFLRRNAGGQQAALSIFGIRSSSVLDFIGVGFWMIVLSQLALLLIGWSLLRRLWNRSTQLRRTVSSGTLAIGIIIFLAGYMWPPVHRPELGPLSPRWSPYASQFQDTDWEVWLTSSVVAPVIILVGLLVVLRAPTDRSFQAGLWGMFYLTAVHLMTWIASDAEGEQFMEWSLGGWIAVAGSLVVLMAGVLEYLDERSNNQVLV